MDTSQQLGDFLSTRRARLQPQDVGLPYYGTRRRVPGLRREELAQLAGVSADYYARLEQGRLDNVSFTVLDAVATALRLSDDERGYLYQLAHPPAPGDEPVAPVLRPALHALLAAMEQIPAYIVGHRTNILGWNHAATVLFGIDFATLPGPQRNWAHLVLLDPRLRTLLAGEQPVIARQITHDLRMRLAHRPGDSELRDLVDRMRSSSAQFDELWSSHDVVGVAHGVYHFQHPEVGPISLDYEFLPLTADPGVRAMVAYTIAPGEAGQRALRELITRSLRFGDSI
ncbi:helix-turn-helix transcriptional regulator [Nocardia sp. NPDC056000]|uniref:helix-turn-helix transcriptional regulator n=1 Tax=Nocardia sp. NPDC056000 TaxID=3345674 RepID=UPI0035DF7FE0